MVTAPPVDGAGDEEEVPAPPPGIPAFVNVFEDDLPELRIGGNKPFLQTAVEALCIMFWDGDTRDHWMLANNMFGPDPIAEEFARNSRIHTEPGQNTPPPPTMRRMAIAPSEESSSVVDRVFRDADELYMRTLVDQSRAMNDGFRTAAATPASGDTLIRTSEATIGAPIPS